MALKNKFHQLKHDLEKELPISSSSQRQKWAHEILINQINVHDLLDLLNGEIKVATRFLWLLTDFGEIAPQRLHEILPNLLMISKTMSDINFRPSMANYWLICGIPEENESEAIDLLFKWLISSKSNITTKDRSMKVLLKVIKRYPELKDELIMTLELQIHSNTKDFNKKISKTLQLLKA